MDGVLFSPGFNIVFENDVFFLVLYRTFQELFGHFVFNLGLVVLGVVVVVAEHSQNYQHKRDNPVTNRV